MGACEAYGAEEAPGDAVEVAAVEGVLVVAVEEGLGVEVEDFEEEEGVWGEEEVGGVVDEELWLTPWLLWFQTPRELPRVRKSQRAVAKGRRRSLSVAS